MNRLNSLPADSAVNVDGDGDDVMTTTAQNGGNTSPTPAANSGTNTQLSNTAVKGHMNNDAAPLRTLLSRP